MERVTILLTLVASSHCARTLLQVNEGDFASDLPVDIDTVKDYLTFVSRSSTFIDKSLYIHMVISRWFSYNVLYMNFPPKWGKTMNLRLIQAYTTLHVNEYGQPIEPNNTYTFEYFTRGVVKKEGKRYINLLQVPIIGRHMDFFVLHFAKYPTIYLEFGTIRGKNYREFLHKFRTQIAVGFQQHAYLLQTNISSLLNVSQINTFKSLLNVEQTNEQTLINSLFFLSELLNTTYKEQVTILVDDIDLPMNWTLFEPNITDREQTIKFYHSFIRTSFRNNSHIFKSIMTGVLRYGQLNFPSEFTFIIDFTSLHIPFFEYYAFSTYEVTELEQHHDLNPKERQLVRDWYGGYEMPGSTVHELYNPWSTMNYMCNGRTQRYWVEDGTLDFILPKAFAIEYFENALSMLLTTSRYLVSLYRYRFGMTDFQQFLQTNPRKASDIALEFLLEFGYLTLRSQYPRVSNHRKTALGIPNKEVYNELQKLTSRYFETKFHIPEGTLYQHFLLHIGKELQRYAERDNVMPYSLESAIKHFLDALPPFHIQGGYNPKITLPSNDRTIRSVINFALCYTNWKFFMGLDDLLINQNGRGIGIFLKHNGTMFNSEQWAEEENYLKWVFRRYRVMEIVKVIEINVMPNKTVKVRHQYLDNSNRLNRSSSESGDSDLRSEELLQLIQFTTDAAIEYL